MGGNTPMSSQHELVSRSMWDYLLGNLDGKTSASLEEHYFADREAFLHMRAVECALITCYFEGKLSESDRQLFEARYLTDPELQRRMDEVRRRMGSTVPVKPQKGTIWNWALAIGTTAVVILALWITRPVWTPAPRQQSKAPAAAQVQVYALTLDPFAAKGPGGKQPVFELPGIAGVLQLNLRFPGRSAPFLASCRVMLAGEQGERPTVWKSDHSVEARQDSAGWTVTFEMPTSVLRRGDYVVEATDPAHDVQESYMLTVRPAKP